MDALTNSIFFGAGLTLVCYDLALHIKKRLKWAIFNPFLVAIVLILAVLRLLDMDYAQYEASAKYLGYFMTPATICLAVPLYRELDELKRNFAAVAGGVLAAVLTNLAVIFAMCSVLGLGHIEYVSLLPKSVTTPIGVALTAEYGGVSSITVLAILFTGIVGNVIGESLLRILRVRHSVSRGLALGAAAHGIGTAKAIELGQTEGAMSGLAIAVTGVITVAVAPFFVNLI